MLAVYRNFLFFCASFIFEKGLECNAMLTSCQFSIISVQYSTLPSKNPPKKRHDLDFFLFCYFLILPLLADMFVHVYYV